MSDEAGTPELWCPCRRNQSACCRRTRPRNGGLPSFGVGARWCLGQSPASLGVGRPCGRCPLLSQHHRPPVKCVLAVPGTLPSSAQDAGSHGRHAFERWHQTSFRPSELFRKTKMHAIEVKGRPSFRRRLANVPTVTKSKDKDKPAQLKRACRSRSFFLYFLSPYPSPSSSQPVHGERKAFVAVTVPRVNLSGNVATVNRGNPATPSYPRTHPSLLGRGGPWPCGSSRLLSRAPNPRERALLPRLTNPAQ